MKRSICQNLPYFLMALISFASCLAAGAQDIETTLTNYADKYGQEKMYLHYDKPAYSPGETIWFKAYLLEGLMPGLESKTLYVDWVDEKGAVLQHSVSPLVGAVTNGQFDVPETFAGTFIHVRAYTRWMLNFDTTFVYSKNIRIIGKAAATPAPAVVPALQFFPEGGDAVAGINNKIAFKAADQWGRPVAVRGVIESDGTIIDSFNSVHDGMGYFFLQPEAGATYTARWRDAKGKTYTTPLPPAKSTGISLQVIAQGRKRQFVISRPADAAASFKQLHLVGTMFQRPAFKATIDLNSTSAKKGSIPTESLPTGILTITVFDAAWNAIAERITYVDNGEYSFAANMQVQHWGLNKRAKNEIQITVPDSLATSLSVAITDAALESDSSQNIFSQLLLTGDLKGQVYNPAYYFSGKDAGGENMDLVMLTHGWRRFKWEDVVKGKYPSITYPKDTTYLALSGKLYGVQQGQLGNNASIIMFVKQKDSSSRMVMAQLNANGTFEDPNLLFFDTLNVYYQLQPAKALRGGDVRFMENRLPPLNYKKQIGSNVFAPVFDTVGTYRHLLLARAKADADALMKEKMLANVTVKARTKTPAQQLDEKYTSGLFSGGDGYQFSLLDDVAANGYRSIFDYLQGKVAGLQINIAGGEVNMDWRGSKPQVYLDEMPTDADMISNIPVNDIAYVKVLRPPFMGGFGGGSGGAIAIYTRKGNDVAPTPGSGMNRNTITGYTPIRQFYAPNYASFDARNEQRDIRTTLYWNPMLTTNAGKKTVTLTFYNNDVTKAFRVIIEGMSSDGRLTHVEQVME